MPEEPTKPGTDVLRQLKTSISRFIERIGQEVQQLHQAVDTIQHDFQSFKTQTNAQFVELADRINSLETQGVRRGESLLDTLPLKTSVNSQSRERPSSLGVSTTPIPPSDMPSHEPAAPIQSVPEVSQTLDALSSLGVEEKEEKRELLKALQLIDSL